MFDDQSKETTSALLYLDGISVSFDGFKALNELSLIVEPGEMRAIIGPNGAGKTTMMDVITGKTRPDTGDVYFEAGTIDLSKLDETQIAMLGIGRKFQKPTVFEMHTVEDNLQLALKNDRSVRATLLWEDLVAAAGAHRRATRHHPPQAGSLAGSRRPVARAEAVAGDRHAAGAGTETAAGRRTGRRHDRRRDHADRGAAQGNQQDQDRGGGRARHGFRARARRQGDLPARRLGAGRRHHRPGFAPTSAWSKCIWDADRCSK